MFLLFFLAGAGGETDLMASDDLSGLAALFRARPASGWVSSLLLRFGGATGAGAGSDITGFGLAAAAGIQKNEKTKPSEHTER